MLSIYPSCGLELLKVQVNLAIVSRKNPSIASIYKKEKPATQCSPAPSLGFPVFNFRNVDTASWSHLPDKTPKRRPQFVGIVSAFEAHRKCALEVFVFGVRSTDKMRFRKMQDDICGIIRIGVVRLTEDCHTAILESTIDGFVQTGSNSERAFAAMKIERNTKTARHEQILPLADSKEQNSSTSIRHSAHSTRVFREKLRITFM